MKTIVRLVRLRDWKDIKQYLYNQSSEEKIKKNLVDDIKRIKLQKILRIVVEADGKVVGSCRFRKLSSPIKQHIVEINGMVVNENFQGQGLSSKMMEYGFLWAKKQKMEIAVLSVREGTKAEKIYKHMGFKVYGKLNGGIREPWENKKTYNEIFLYKMI